MKPTNPFKLVAKLRARKSGMLGTKDVFPNKINVPQKATVLQEQEEEVGAFFVILYIDSGL